MSGCLAKRLLVDKRLQHVAWRVFKNYWDDKIKNDELGKACSAHREMRSAYEILVRTPRGNGFLGKIRYIIDGIRY
jgi:hypothetical protein